jgi:hypothetical protein
MFTVNWLLKLLLLISILTFSSCSLVDDEEFGKIENAKTESSVSDENFGNTQGATTKSSVSDEDFGKKKETKKESSLRDEDTPARGN